MNYRNLYLNKRLDNGNTVFYNFTNDHDYSKQLPAEQMKVFDLPDKNMAQTDGFLIDIDLNLSSIENILSPSVSLSNLMVSPDHLWPVNI